MITDLEQYRNNVSELSDLEDTRYENIFKLAKDDKHFFYNIIKKIKFDDDINPDYYYIKIYQTNLTVWHLLLQ